MSSAILDASAVLALLNGEPGGPQVQEALAEGAAMSTVNIAEVVSKLAERGADESSTRGRLAPLDIDVIDFSVTNAYSAGALRPLTRRLGLSLGDRACMALAMDLGLPVLTADRRWADLDPALGVNVRLLR